MSIEAIVGITVGALTILGYVGWFVYKLIRDNIMVEVHDKIIDLKDGLETQIIETGKKNIKYMGEACEDRLRTYEKQNEEIRKERQIRYQQNIQNIYDLMDNIKEVLNVIQNDIKKNGEASVRHETNIEAIKQEIQQLRKKA